MHITRMAGGNTSSSCGSGRAHFRSQSGCCICGTKSSSSRFTISQRYSEHFRDCFGASAATRAGDLCNACVLCVKRWLQRGRQPGLFSKVLDSKKGAGPKHMKEITKRARRREARQANVNNKKVNIKPEPCPLDSTASVPVTPSIGRHHSGTSGVVSPTVFQCVRNSIISTGPSLSTRSACSSGWVHSSTHSGNGSFAHRLNASWNELSNMGYAVTDASFSSSRSASNNALKSTPDETKVRNYSLLHSSTPCASCCWCNKLCSPHKGQCSGSTGGGRAGDSSATNVGVSGVGSDTNVRNVWNTQPEGATLTRAAAARKSEAATVRALSCSTPSRGATASLELAYLKCTPSETSEYGSFNTLGSSTGSNRSGISHTNSSVGPTSAACCCCSCCCCCCCCHCCCCCCLGTVSATTDRSVNNTSRSSASTGLGRSLSSNVSTDDCPTYQPEPCKRAKYDTVIDKRCSTGSVNPSTQFPCCHCPIPHHCCTVNCHGNGSSGSSCCSTPNSTAVAPSPNTGMNPAEFRHPPPPPTASGPNTRLADANHKNTETGSTVERAMSSNAGSSSTSADGHAAPNAQNTSGTNGMPSMRRYNRRVVLPPVRMTRNDEVNSLLREIMERNSQAINFDSREMHMAVQQRLRSRNAQANSTSGSISGRASSISSADGSVDACGSQILSGSRTPDGGAGGGGGSGVTGAIDDDELFRCPIHGVKYPRPHTCYHNRNHCDHPHHHHHHHHHHYHHHHHHHYHCSHKNDPCFSCCFLLQRSTPGEIKSMELRRT